MRSSVASAVESSSGAPPPALVSMAKWTDSPCQRADGMFVPQPSASSASEHSHILRDPYCGLWSRMGSCSVLGHVNTRQRVQCDSKSGTPPRKWGGEKLRVSDQRSVAVPKVDRRTFLPGRQLEGQQRKAWDCGLDSFPLRQRGSKVIYLSKADE